MNSQPFGSIVKPNNYNKLLTSPDSRASDEVLTIVDDNIYDPGKYSSNKFGIL